MAEIQNVLDFDNKVTRCVSVDPAVKNTATAQNHIPRKVDDIQSL